MVESVNQAIIEYELNISHNLYVPPFIGLPVRRGGHINEYRTRSVRYLVLRSITGKVWDI